MNTYKMCYVDFDTCLFRAAKSCQKDFIIVVEKETGVKQRFDGVSKFYGLGPSKSKGWIGEQNKIRESLGQPLLTVDDFTIEEHAELVNDFDTVIQNALSQLDYAVGRIKKASEAEDYRLCIGGSSNWRYDKAHIKTYKGMRKAKPLLFLEVKEAFVSKYKNKVIIVDGFEVDDFLGIMGWQNYQNYVKTGVYENILSYVDKDLLSIISPHFNYDKPEEGISIPTPTEAAFHFCSQLLSGDLSTDNIQGLPALTKEFQEKYGLRKTKGIGKETAHKILEGLSIKEMFERVVEAYRGYYGDVKQPFTSFRGEVFQWNYLDYLKENALMLWMQRYEGQLYDIEDTLKLLKIEY